MAHAIHVQQETMHTVLIGALRVLVTREGDNLWSAQGVEIDYSACGNSLEDAQKRFETGLIGTIRSNLERFGTIDRILKWAPHEEIARMSELAQRFDVTMLTLHPIKDLNLPFANIAYIQEKSMHETS
jgi:hypothetical protein